MSAGYLVMPKPHPVIPQNKRKVLRTTGMITGTAAIVSLSAVMSTKVLMHLAVGRANPGMVRVAERLFAGAAEDNEFLKARIAAGERLKSRGNKTVSIKSFDGQTLVGHWMPAEHPKRIIIAFHGWRATWYQTFGLPAENWEKNGCSALFVEQRASNSSTGDTISFGLLERFDVQAWVAWINEQFGKSLPIYLYGVSMGASTVLMAADQDLPDVHGIISDCGYTSPKAIWKHVANNNLHIAFGIHGLIADRILKSRIKMGLSDYSTVRALKNTGIPIFFIHGADDHFVPVEMTYENYLACAGPKRLLIIPGADHAMSCYLEREKYEMEVLSFWNDYD